MKKETENYEILTISKSAQEVIDAYFNLPLGNKKVKCPYFMNRHHIKGGLRVMIGKGSPEEIVHEVKVWAKLKGLDLNKMSEKQIREFMQKLSIGIDCSGFVAHVMNAYLKDLGFPPLQKILTFKKDSILDKIRRFLRPIENISSDDMTSNSNCKTISNLNDVLPGSFIRVREKREGAYHVALIHKVYKQQNKVVKFEYVHSHSKYEEENGVRKGVITVIDPKKNLDKQIWDDNYKGRNYIKEDFISHPKENFVKRLKIFY